ncbi:M57 family metalloprotease [Aquimarina sp. AU474]|uniref:zinc-dependent metalloprotease family protein n=1 Tax=Aquimarina sp. AU474 TaxID=2108529 RepID=UPI000D69ADCE|nr:M57 family metalloprotease [Aquimarina sp. AU474]
MKKLFQKLFFISLFIVVPISCSEDDLFETENVQHDDSVLKTISDWGFSKDDIEDKGDYYVVDGDIVFYKNKKYLSPSNENTKQRRHPNSVTINTVNVFINPGMNTDWRNASRDAINRWNAVSNSPLRLNITSSQASAHIQIMYDSQDPNVALAGNVFGMGEFPSANGLPGVGIWVNPDFNSNLYCNKSITQNMRISNVQHELGHNLGITHTNQTFGDLIPGTSTTDNSSVMNGGQACTINNFSSGDITAIEYLFPWVGLPRAYTRNPDPTICTNVFVQSDRYMLPVSPGADTYELTSNSSDLYVDRFVSPGQEITMITNRTGNYRVTLKTTNSFGSSYATIYVTAVSCNGGGIGF